MDPVASRTANDTPTMENANAPGASTRSARSSRKSRYPSAGNRRARPGHGMTDIRSGSYVPGTGMGKTAGGGVMGPF